MTELDRIINDLQTLEGGRYAVRLNSFIRREASSKERKPHCPHPSTQPFVAVGQNQIRHKSVFEGVMKGSECAEG